MDNKPSQGRHNKKEKKNQKVHLEEYLGFKIAAKKEPPPVRIKKVQQKGLQDITLSPYCSFAIRLPAEIIQYHTDPNIPLEWETIGMVTRLTTHQFTCPICLDHEFTACRVNRCGHLFCWPCVIRYLWATENQAKRCPICFDPVKGSNLRPMIIKRVEAVQEGNTIEMQLLMREKGKISLFKCGEPIQEKVMQSFIDYKSSHAVFNRITLQLDERSILEDQKSQLEACLVKTEDSFERSAIEKALEYVGKEIESSHANTNDTRNTEEPLRNPSKYYYLYQISDGQPYFLHPLNVKMMLKEYGNFENFPVKITGKVLEIEDTFITEFEIKKLGIFNHIARGATVSQVEIDMRGICSYETTRMFDNELHQRANKRRRLKVKEERCQQEIAKRSKAEEEANNLLMAYFENPQVAVPVRRVTPPKKIEEVKKIEEKKESEEAGKSIWSSFTDVLKKPPRQVVRSQRQTESKEKEEENGNEDPPKLTLFDLVKHKSMK
ncbi:unnamed protein product [Blepharisma stoltei]|uniref:RING-type domain-containing protein n=1 Tax=Blepharisma stoltei TaxID=1481888 RepID=A0AAU9JQ90_9CILI|nr:unnamed protein product [Blepharisma stoltei]